MAPYVNSKSDAVIKVKNRLEVYLKLNSFKEKKKNPNDASKDEAKAKNEILNHTIKHSKTTPEQVQYCGAPQLKSMVPQILHIPPYA